MEQDLVELTLVDYGHLITKKKIDEGDNFEDFVNNDSQHDESAVGDANLRNLKQGEVIQLERKGYYICVSTKWPLLPGRAKHGSGCEHCTLIRSPGGICQQRLF